MSGTAPPFADGHVFAATTVSEAWGRALLSLGPRGAERDRSHVLFVVDGDPDAIEIPAIREALDDHLGRGQQTLTKTVAWTVFPHSIWRMYPEDRTAFFEAYRASLPRFVAADRKRNGRGIYFGRMVGFDLDPATGERMGGATMPDGGNQLETLLRKYGRGQETRKGVQRGHLQVAVFDPARDHVAGPWYSFPCLQHVTFEPKGGALHTNAFYATQQLVRKAYGNLLGLHQLGAFMAREMGLRPGRLAVYVGVERLGDGNRSDYDSLVDSVGTALAETVG